MAHLDLYRLGSLAGEDPALLDDYLTPERIGFVEWPEAARAGARARGGAGARSSTPAATGARIDGRVNLLGLDTSTAASAACVLRADGEAFERRARAGARCRAARRTRAS